MPRILVMADEGEGREAVVLLHERVVPGELETDRSSALLIERVGWALVDADEIEHEAPSPTAPPAACGRCNRKPGSAFGRAGLGSARAARASATGQT